jgi:peptidoglycan hydrolase-like protein with peptidoglycan-binding domain
MVPAWLTPMWQKERNAMSAPEADVQVSLSLPTLRKGQHGNEPPVERLQYMLNFVKGSDDLDVDGIFGPKTEAAVRSFQQNENLSADGIVGKQTWTALLRRWLLFSRPG